MERIGPYRVDRRLGSGGMGVVYAAWDTGLERPVALKVISPQLADDPGFRARFTREARAQAALVSDQVVQVYAHGEDDGRPWIASQLVPDGDLGQLLRQYGAPPVPVALDLIGQVASGLADAHQAGLVHRDIKPANVLLRRGPRIRAYLADFGIAGSLDGQTGTGTGTAGTPAYLAPELHTGGTAGVASDVYSLGCLLWALLAGRAPYAGTSDFEVATAHRERPVPQLTGHDAQSVALNAVLRTALAKRPEDRYPTAAAFREAVAATATLPSEPPRRRFPVRLAALAAGTVVVLVAVLIGGYVVTRPATAPSQTPQVSAEERAAVAFADSLVETDTVPRNQADCVAGALIGEVGFEGLVAAGFFSEDGRFLDPDLADEQEVRRALRRAAFDCAG